jgi:hypothetical protein
MLPSELVIAVMPHLIPAPTIANDDVARAESEPLAEGRDETIYLICSHPRVRLEPALDDGSHPALIARLDQREGMRWDPLTWWARVRLPPHATASQIPWAVIDPSLEQIERLAPRDAPFDADPDGPAGENRADLLGWVYDRHLELREAPSVPRGSVHGGAIDFRLEYVGLSLSEAGALRRAAGAHHKVPRILGRILLYEPHRLVYVLPCEIRVLLHDPEDPAANRRMLRLDEAVAAHGTDRRLLVETAEHALIALGGTSYNRRNAVRRVFPATDAGDRLRAEGVRRVLLGFWGLPERVRISGRAAFDVDSAVKAFDLGAP